VRIPNKAHLPIEEYRKGDIWSFDQFYSPGSGSQRTNGTLRFRNRHTLADKSNP